MKKNTLYIIGFTIQCVGIGLMLYGLNTSRVLLWTAFPLVFIGMLVILIGLISNRDKNKYR